jgi:septum formation protein
MSVPPRLILASASPRRRELLGLLGLPFDVVTSDFPEPEHVFEGRDPAHVVVEFAIAKAKAVAARIDGDALVIGADTTVALDDQVYNKPTGADDAIRMLRALSGRTHQVHTGIAIVPVVDGRAGEPLSDVAATDVTFGVIPDDVARAYVATGEPLDKAGAYGIQGRALAFIPEIKGDYFNVVGLPLNKLVALLTRFGVGVW